MKCGVPAHRYTDPHAPTHTRTYHSTHRTDTHMQRPHANSSGPHKFDVRLLLYCGCHKIDSFVSSGTRQLPCGFSIVLLGSSSAESNPVISCQIRDFENPEHAPRSPPGTQTCAVVYRRAPACPAAESARKDPRAPSKRVQMSKTKKRIGTNFE